MRGRAALALLMRSSSGTEMSTAQNSAAWARRTHRGVAETAELLDSTLAEGDGNPPASKAWPKCADIIGAYEDPMLCGRFLRGRPSRSRGAHWDRPPLCGLGRRREPHKTGRGQHPAMRVRCDPSGGAPTGYPGFHLRRLISPVLRVCSRRTGRPRAAGDRLWPCPTNSGPARHSAAISAAGKSPRHGGHVNCRLEGLSVRPALLSVHAEAVLAGLIAT